MWEKMKFVASSMWEFLKPFIRIFLSSIGPILAKAASMAVLVAASKAISNQEKHESAYNDIVLSLERQGFQMGADFTESMINAAIEAAVQKMKS